MKTVKEMWALLNVSQKAGLIFTLLAFEAWLLIMPW